jgi:hypothetical protein
MKDKGKILIGKCDSLLEAIRRKEEYIELWFHPNIIVIHPDNYEFDEIQLENICAQVTDSTELR